MRIEILKKRKIVEYAALILILLGGFGVRLYKIKNPIADWHSWRQVDTASVSRVFVDEGINLLYPRYYDISSIQTGFFNPQGERYVEFPIQSAIHAILYKLIPKISFDVWGRLTSIIASVITTYLIYLLGKRYTNTLGSLAAAFFFAFIPFNIYFSRVILPEPMATMFAVASIWFISEYIKKEKVRYLYSGALSFSFAILLKPYAGFYAIPIIYMIIKKYGVKGIFKNIHLLLALDLALVPFFAWRAFIFPKEWGIPHLKWAFNGDGIRFRPAFWRWIFGERLGHLILGTWGLIPFGYAFIKKHKKEPIIMLMLMGMLLFVTVVATASVRHDYYQTITIPAIALMLGKGFSDMWNDDNKKFTVRIFLLFTVVMMLGMGAYQVKEFYKVNHPEFVEAGKALDSIAPKDALVIAPDNGNTVFLYYTKRKGWPVLEGSIQDAIKLGADYYISVNKNDADTSKFSKEFEIIKEEKNFLILDLNRPKK